jgi:lipid-A-disaccharide synthase
VNKKVTSPGGAGRTAEANTGPVMIVAGEISGDMHAAALVRAIRERAPDLEFFGIGGPRMRAAGVSTAYDVHDMAVVGLTEVLRRFGFFRRVLRQMCREARDRRPAAVILVDYPGFNLRLADRAHALGLKTIYYVCPQVWAWHRGRIPRMARVLDRMVTIFPFEGDCFAGTSLKVDYVGHPLVDEARTSLREPPADLPWNGNPRVALLPGSRVQEVERILPRMLGAVALVRSRHPRASSIVACPSDEVEAVVRRMLSRADGEPGAMPRVVTGRTRHVLRQASAALVASGTATIEASLMRCPMVVTYRMRPVSYRLARRLVRIRDIAMVNIVAGRRICSELVQDAGTPEALAAALQPLLLDTPDRARMLEELDRVNRLLGAGGAAERAANVVLDELGRIIPPAPSDSRMRPG